MDHISLTSALHVAELSALRLDGEVSIDGFEWDIPQTWQTRCSKILGNERHPIVLTGISAVWGLLGSISEPHTHTASTVTENRIRNPENPLLTVEERSLKLSDYWLTNRVGVTTPLRTITDVLRMEELADEVWSHAALTVKTHFRMDTAIILKNIQDMISVPNKRLALTRAELLAG